MSYREALSRCSFVSILANVNDIDIKVVLQISKLTNVHGKLSVAHLYTLIRGEVSMTVHATIYDFMYMESKPVVVDSLLYYTPELQQLVF